VLIDTRLVAEGLWVGGGTDALEAGPDTSISGFNIPHIILQPLQQDVGYKTEQIIPVAIFPAHTAGPDRPG